MARDYSFTGSQAYKFSEFGNRARRNDQRIDPSAPNRYKAEFHKLGFQISLISPFFRTSMAILAPNLKE